MDSLQCRCTTDRFLSAVFIHKENFLSLFHWIYKVTPCLFPHIILLLPTTFILMCEKVLIPAFMKLSTVTFGDPLFVLQGTFNANYDRLLFSQDQIFTHASHSFALCVHFACQTLLSDEYLWGFCDTTCTITFVCLRDIITDNYLLLFPKLMCQYKTLRLEWSSVE